MINFTKLTNLFSRVTLPSLPVARFPTLPAVQLTPRLENNLKTGLTLAALSAVASYSAKSIAAVMSVRYRLAAYTLLTLGNFWFVRDIQTMMQDATPLREGELRFGFDLHKIVAELIQDEHINLAKVPPIFISPSFTLNACAGGRHCEHAMIIVCEGLLMELLRLKQGNVAEAEKVLKGVLCHELGHVINEDTTTFSLANLLSVFNYTLVDQQYALTREQQGFFDKNTFTKSVIKKLSAQLLVQYVHRTRETAADDLAIQCGQGEALKEFLELLLNHENDSNLDPDVKELLKPVLENKYVGWLQSSWGWRQVKTALSTHPLTEERIERINQFTAQR